jgi:endoglycosylceramidase
VRRRPLLGAALGCCLLAAAAAPAGAAPGRGAAAAVPTDPGPVGTISHAGRWLTDADGRVVLLHGVNMVEKEAPYYPSADGFDGADAAWLAANGLDVVRLGVLPTGLMPTPGVISRAYLAHLAATVATLGRHHVYVLLDLHQDGWGPTVGSDGFPAWMTLTHGATNTHAPFPDYYIADPATQAAFQSLWDDDPGPNGVGLQTDVADMFGALAAEFARAPNLLGYDAFNEPWPGTTWHPCLTAPGGCPSLVSAELDPLYARVDRAIRRHDRDHLLFTEPFVLFNYGMAPTTVGRPDGDPETGLAFHQYALSTADAADVLANAVTWSARTGGAVLDTEWGATQTTDAIEGQAAQFDSALVPWIFWSFDGEMAAHLTRPPSGPNLVASTVDAVVRPYPLVVGGTPTSLSYAPATHVLTAAWSTTEPDGRRAAPGTVSTLEVPALDEPDGYSATVTGGRVTSAPCAPALTVASGPGAPAVSVTLTPGGRCR